MAAITCGVIWSVMFPKSMSLNPGMVASVCIGIGLFGTGILVALANRIRPAVLILSLALLGSLLANAYLIAEVSALVEVLFRSTARPR